MAFKHDINYFFNPDNFPNQDTIFEIADYLNSVPYRMLDFEAATHEGESIGTLKFLNILYCQIQFLETNLDKPFDAISHFHELPLGNRHKTVFFGLILKWLNGSQAEKSNTKYTTCVKLLERSFKGLTKRFTKDEYFDLELEAINNLTRKEIQLVSQPETKETPAQNTTIKPIRLTAKCPSNLIPTLFYKLKTAGYIDISATDLNKLLQQIIVDETGEPLKEKYLSDILNGSRSKDKSRSQKVDEFLPEPLPKST